MSRKSELISTQDAAAALGVSKQRLRELARQGRVLGATKVERDWVIPSPPVVLPPSRPPGYLGQQKTIEEWNRSSEIFRKRYGEGSAPEFLMGGSRWDPRYRR
jgi:hypothetical protein